MNLNDIIRIIKSNIFYILFFPLLLSIVVWFTTKIVPETYKSTAVLYTGVVSGMDISNGGDNQMDYNSANNAFDNIISIIHLSEILEETGIRLLIFNAQSPELVDPIVQEKAIKILQNTGFDPFMDKSSLENSVKSYFAFKQKFPSNKLTMLLDSNHLLYSIKSINKRILAKRKGSSDLVEIEYSSPDRFSTYNTLSILSEVFIRKYKELKDRETVTVIAYFENRLAESKSKLDGIEQKLLDFHVDNKIINYYEQTKQVTISKQQLLENIEKEKQLLASSESSLSNIELKLNKRAGILSVNELLLKKRNELSSLIYKISNLEAYSKSAKELPELKKQAEVLKEDIKSTISNIYEKNNSPEGLEHGSLIDDWIKYELAIDESKSRLKIMNKQLSEFANDYEKYAPMGSILKALERDAEISEKEYFEILHALNLARLKHQNIQYGNNLRILEPALVPDNVGIKKRVILSGVSLVLGMFLILAYLIGKEIADDSLKNAKNFMQSTGVRPIGTLLKSVKKPSKQYSIYEKVLKEQLKANLETKGDQTRIKAAFVSIRPHENQDEVLLKISQTLSSNTFITISLIEKEGQNKSEFNNIPTIKIDALQETLQKKLTSPWDFESSDSTQRKVHLLELPPLVKWPMSIQMTHLFDVIYLVVNAELQWGENEQYYFDQLKSSSGDKISVIINNADFSRVKFDYKYLI